MLLYLTKEYTNSVGYFGVSCQQISVICAKLLLPLTFRSCHQEKPPSLPTPCPPWSSTPSSAPRRKPWPCQRSAYPWRPCFTSMAATTKLGTTRSATSSQRTPTSSRWGIPTTAEKVCGPSTCPLFLSLRSGSRRHVKKVTTDGQTSFINILVFRKSSFVVLCHQVQLPVLNDPPVLCPLNSASVLTASSACRPERQRLPQQTTPF